MTTPTEQFNYFHLLRGPLLLPQPWPRFKPKHLKGLTTSHPTYCMELGNAVGILKEYFATATKDTPPLNCLILGPPGAGKTHLAKQLAKSVDKPYEEHNVSLSSDPKSMLEELSKHAGGQKFVFIDEFDVTIAGSSVVRFLLDPITSEEKHHETVFVFSGSYLKNKPILERLNTNLTDFDLPLFLFHLIARQEDPQIRKHLLQLYQMCCLYQENRQTFTPDADLIQYLSQLHKLRDFLSRINGFILQIPDLASPMMIAEHPLLMNLDPNSIVHQNHEIRLLESKTAEYVRQFVEDSERNGRKMSNRFSGKNSAIVAFKHMLLTERMGILRFVLDKYIKSLDKGGKKTFFIKIQDLNFLVMAPLQHNIRSLKFLVERCLVQPLEKTGDELTLEQEHFHWPNGLDKNLCRNPYLLMLDTTSPIYSTHVAKEPFFDTPVKLWDFLRTANPEKDTQDPDLLLPNVTPESLICLSHLKGVITVLLIGDTSQKEIKKTWVSLYNQTKTNEVGEELFHHIQVIPIGTSNDLKNCLNKQYKPENPRMNILDNKSNPFKTIPKQFWSDEKESVGYRLLLGQQILGFYTLILDAGDQLAKEFLVKTISELLKDSKKSYVVTGLTGEKGTVEFKEGRNGRFKILENPERYTFARPVLCNTAELKELILLHPTVKWPLSDSAHYLEYPETRDKTVSLKCKEKLFTRGRQLTIAGSAFRIVKVNIEEAAPSSPV
jgi:hypothetical protein